MSHERSSCKIVVIIVATILFLVDTDVVAAIIAARILVVKLVEIAAGIVFFVASLSECPIISFAVVVKHDRLHVCRDVPPRQLPRSALVH